MRNKLLPYIILVVLNITITFVNLSFSAPPPGNPTPEAPTLGDGSLATPYQIATVENLYWLTQNSSVWNKNFIQTSDIDANSVSWDAGSGFTPIGNYITQFTGSFDGQGFKIQNIYISRSSTPFIGLFGYTSNAILSNIFVENAQITGNNGTSALVGFASSSEINSCYSNGCTIIGQAAVGGLIGQCYMTPVSCCYSSNCVVKGIRSVGGVIGEFYTEGPSTITNCFSRGSEITLLVDIGDSQTDAGGLIGYMGNSCSAIDCYSTSIVSGSAPYGYIGGLIGFKYSTASVTDCFWDTQTSGQSSSNGGTGKTTAEMKTQSTYTNWDFATEWQISASNYPTLRCILTTPLPVELTTFTVNVKDKNVELNWVTATEVNNYGFQVQRKIEKDQSEWEEVTFIQGHGNSNSPKYYSFTDNSISESGKYAYRLKQIDIDGIFEYSSEVEVIIGSPNKYELTQNYPNPFNPSTSISYSIPVDGFVTLIVYDMLGRQVFTLENNYKKAGNYINLFDASKLTSGIYFYTIKAGSFTSTKKMLLMK